MRNLRYPLILAALATCAAAQNERHPVIIKPTIEQDDPVAVLKDLLPFHLHPTYVDEANFFTSRSGYTLWQRIFPRAGEISIGVYEEARHRYRNQGEWNYRTAKQLFPFQRTPLGLPREYSNVGVGLKWHFSTFRRR